MTTARPALAALAATFALSAHALLVGSATAQPQQPSPGANAPQPEPAVQPRPVVAQPQSDGPNLGGVRLQPRPGSRPGAFLPMPPSVVGVRPAGPSPSPQPQPQPPGVRPAPRAQTATPHRGRAPARRVRAPAPPPVPPGVELSVSPVPNRGRYFYVVELRPTTWESADVLADRRLLRFEVVPLTGGRAVSCASAGAPSFRRASARVRALGAGGATEWREWLDIRDYCWGRALALLDRGARVEARYGFARARRGEWVAHRAGPGDPASASLLVAAPLDVAAPPAPAAATAPVDVRMRPVDAATGDRLAFAVSIRSTGGPARVYPRPDLYRFVVDGPSGRTECGLERTPIVPIRDFYQTITRTRGVGASVDVRFACPDVFREAGVYDVTPVVTLPYDGARYELEVVTGTFVGAPAPVRIRVGAHGFVEHPPATLPPAPPGPAGTSRAATSAGPAS